MGLGILLGFGVLVYAAFRGPKIAGNPFGAASLEWQSSSPPDFHNFIHKPILCDPYDFGALVYDEELDTYILREFMEPSEEPEMEPEPQVH